jgi:hypothetical protein
MVLERGRQFLEARHRAASDDAPQQIRACGPDPRCRMRRATDEQSAREQEEHESGSGPGMPRTLERTAVRSCTAAA